MFATKQARMHASKFRGSEGDIKKASKLIAGMLRTIHTGKTGVFQQLPSGISILSGTGAHLCMQL